MTHKKDGILALSVIGIGLIYLLATYTMTVPDYSDATGPKSFPTLLGALMVVTGVGHLIAALSRRLRMSGPGNTNGASPTSADKRRTREVAVYVLLPTFGYVVALPVLGLILVSTLYLLLLFARFNPARKRSNLVVALTAPPALAALFVTFLGVPLQVFPSFLGLI